MIPPSDRRQTTAINSRVSLTCVHNIHRLVVFALVSRAVLHVSANLFIKRPLPKQNNLSTLKII
jgi:hypothetical protein